MDEHMRWMIWPRQYGKTYKLQEWWLEDPQNRVIVTGTEELARIRRRDLADKLGSVYPGLFAQEIDKLLKKRVVSYRSFQSMRGAFSVSDKVALDDVDYILHSIFSVGGPTVVLVAGVGTHENPDPVIAAQSDKFWERTKHMIPPEFWHTEGR